MGNHGSPPVLDDQLIGNYEERLVAQGVPLGEWGRPGLTSLQMEKTVRPLGLALPTEARVWWGWHDGCPGEGRRKLLGPARQEFLSLTGAVETYRRYREVVQELVVPDIPGLADPDARWNRSWLPIEGPQHPTVIDCSVVEDQPTPVRIIALEDVLGSPRPVAASLGEMVALWVRALDGGAWCWDVEQRMWRVEPERMDEDLRRSPLV